MGQVSFTMDIWSDQNLQSYLAMTAHWIARVEQTNGLKLRTVLITFHCLTGRHDRKLLAKIVLHLLDRAGITSKVHSVTALSFTIISNCFFFKVSHFTMDNASNNKMMMEKLGVSLTGREIPFDPSDHYTVAQKTVPMFGHFEKIDLP